MTVQLKTERFEMRLDINAIERIDAWRKKQYTLPSRAEAIRQLVDLGLERVDQPYFSDTEKLMTLMLCDIHRRMGIDNSVDPEFVESVVHGGHYWALSRQYPGIYHGHFDKDSQVKETFDILDLWDAIEFSFDALSTTEKAKVDLAKHPFQGNIKFPGFDGNSEAEYLNIASLVINKMQRFEIFAGRGSLESHMPTLEPHRRMLSAFKTLKADRILLRLNSDQIIMLLQEWVHPGNRQLQN